MNCLRAAGIWAKACTEVEHARSAPGKGAEGREEARKAEAGMGPKAPSSCSAKSRFWDDRLAERAELQPARCGASNGISEEFSTGIPEQEARPSEDVR